MQREELSEAEEAAQYEVEEFNGEPINPYHAPAYNAKPRSLRLLDSSVVPEQTKHLYDQNKTESPLFSKLPGEIRTTIWKMALGGEGIHIRRSWSFGWNRWAWSATLCRCDETEAQFAARVGKLTSRAGTIKAIDRHRPCNLDERSKPVLLHQLLQTCRQIHWEAALFPFSENTFFFERNLVTYYKADQFLVQQARMIRDIVVSWDSYSSHWTRTSRFFQELNLPALETLTFMECHTWKMVGYPCKLQYSDILGYKIPYVDGEPLLLDARWPTDT